MTELIDLAYGADKKQQLDLYLPENPNGAAVLYAHGGGWIRGDKQKEQDLARTFAQAGFVFAVANYRLAPNHRFPAAQNDLAQALVWLKQSKYQFDRHRVGLFGASAGATMMLNLSEASSLPVAAWSPLVDLANWVAQHQNVRAAVAATGEKAAIDAAFYKYVLQAYLGSLETDLLNEADPLAGLNQNLGPTMIVNSVHELAPLSHALRFQGKAAGLGQNVAVQVIPGTHHARGYTEQALANTLAFFNYYLGGTTNGTSLPTD